MLSKENYFILCATPLILMIGLIYLVMKITRNKDEKALYKVGKAVFLPALMIATARS